MGADDLNKQAGACRQWQAWDCFLRRSYFVCFATIAMATIGLAVLAEPLAQYDNDCQTLRLHEQVVADLLQLQHQQARLLANSDLPAVVERVAIHHLKYQSALVARSESLRLTDSWFGLEKALAGVEKATLETDVPLPGRWLIQTLADQPQSQWLLFLLGSAMVVISMIFFCTPKTSSPENSLQNGSIE